MDSVAERVAQALSDRYRIERELGAGGMATVYLAEDVKHDRKVAIKVLKPELAAVVGAERFLAEIRTTANLQHPQILPLHDSGEADGFLFYVMPYVEGETLQQRLEREKQLPVEEAVRIASVVAGALDYAHRQGVVHRDIKPANILFQDGQPVVSDFGIALAVGAGSGARLTETGLSVGTPFYMSPEQATGEAHVGPPSDLYALGCVLYEMLVGEPPYTGSTAQAVLGKILTGAMAAPREARPSVPANVDAAVRRSLAKVPADRFATGRELAAALADGGFRHGEEAARAGARRGGGSLWNPLSVGATVAAAGLALVLGWQMIRPEPPPAVTDVDIVLGNGGGGGSFDLAPDGSLAVFSMTGSRTILVKRWASSELEMLSGSLRGPRVSPDGRNVIGFDGSIGETVLRSLVGEPDVVGLDARTYAWGAGGSLYLLRSDTLWRRADPEASTEAFVVALEARRGQPGLGPRAQLEMVPGARGVLLTQMGATLEDDVIEAVSLTDGAANTLVQGVTPRLAASGHLVYARADGMLMAAPFDAETLTLASPPVPTGRSVTIANDMAAFALDGRGTLVYASGGTGLVRRRLVRVFPDGRQEVLTQGDLGEGVGTMAVSPDGTRLAFRTGAVNRQEGIWVKTLPDGPLTRVSQDGGVSGGLSWSADAAWLYFSGSGNDLWRVPADASLPAERFLDLERPIAEGQVLSDGTVVVRTYPTGKDRDILVFEPGDTVPRDIFPSDADQSAPDVSPDGRWILYQSREGGRPELFVQPFPRGPGRVQLSTGVGSQDYGAVSRGWWGRDGRTIYFQDTAGALVSVEISSEGGKPRATTPRAVLRPLRGLQWVGLLPDDSFLFTEVEVERGKLTLVLNFSEELKALTGGGP